MDATGDSMPASGNKDVMSQKELQQRAQASMKHGAYSKNLPVPLDGLTTRPEVVQAIRTRALRACKAADAVQNYIAGKVEEGKELDAIAAVKVLPAFQNSAARLLAQLYMLLPVEDNVIDAELSRIDEVLSGNSREITE
jgi:hypothetical protein